MPRAHPAIRDTPLRRSTSAWLMVPIYFTLYLHGGCSAILRPAVVPPRLSHGRELWNVSTIRPSTPFSAAGRNWGCHCEPTGRAYARQMTGSAKQSGFAAAERKLDCFVARAPRNDRRFKHAFAAPRRDARAVARNFRPNRGRGECRMPNAPAASCAKGRKCTRVFTARHRNHPAFPHAMVYGLYAISPAS
jgi:hypothetical protein